MLGKGPSKDSFPALLRTVPNKPISYFVAEERDVARPAHLGALIAAKPRILDMIRGATTAGLLPEQPLLARLSAPIESATAAFLDVVDDAERYTSRLYLQKASPSSGRVVVADNTRIQRPNRHEPNSARSRAGWLRFTGR